MNREHPPLAAPFAHRDGLAVAGGAGTNDVYSHKKALRRGRNLRAKVGRRWGRACDAESSVSAKVAAVKLPSLGTAPP
jgi:hypothetical protein